MSLFWSFSPPDLIHEQMEIIYSFNRFGLLLTCLMCNITLVFAVGRNVRRRQSMWSQDACDLDILVIFPEFEINLGLWDGREVGKRVLIKEWLCSMHYHRFWVSSSCSLSLCPLFCGLGRERSTFLRPGMSCLSHFMAITSKSSQSWELLIFYPDSQGDP
jgi:hypothetical protein